MMDFKHLGINIRKYRLAAQMSQDQLAELSGCCGSFIGKIENGKSLPSLDMVSKIAIALNVPIEQLLLATPEKPKSGFILELEERINRLPASTQIEACKSLSDLLNIIEQLHN